MAAAPHVPEEVFLAYESPKGGQHVNSPAHETIWTPQRAARSAAIYTSAAEIKS